MSDYDLQMHEDEGMMVSIENLKKWLKKVALLNKFI
jgi:hypothetical protein